eukprot:CAMPEP_0176214510 /NCGR_PEP_ID=MMETSP0121_2-20121125/16209_1 /TAXON_ID=160619 /ORGANISM="Kryptoperidinium foliaceum, Strain CCMP 1326" /LENGTH=72 /DNA_ID=CAMNT_0017553601 /DNA_START=843 /DNA_END=1058 /DNA_ORIENTATION=+
MVVAPVAHDEEGSAALCCWRSLRIPPLTTRAPARRLLAEVTELHAVAGTYSPAPALVVRAREHVRAPAALRP